LLPRDPRRRDESYDDRACENVAIHRIDLATKSSVFRSPSAMVIRVETRAIASQFFSHAQLP
jgi:hypothetical protein